jgi:hypothetical protein
MYLSIYRYRITLSARPTNIDPFTVCRIIKNFLFWEFKLFYQLAERIEQLLHVASTLPFQLTAKKKSAFAKLRLRELLQ